jgi:hypothetical protein
MATVIARGTDRRHRHLHLELPQQRVFHMLSSGMPAHPPRQPEWRHYDRWQRARLIVILAPITTLVVAMLLFLL